MDELVLRPVTRAAGTVALPGSKSISNRVLLLSALASGTTTIHDLLDADDVRVMKSALVTLGVRIDGDSVIGVGGRFPVSSAELSLENAGTAVRPLTAVLAILGGDYLLRGSARMHERPIGDLVDGLRAIGARIDCIEREGFLPLRIGKGTIDARKVHVRGDVSSQFVTSLLMALPLQPCESVLEVTTKLISTPYVAMTLALMSRFGVTVRNDSFQRFTIPAQGYLSPASITVEGDASSASYFLAAGAIAGGPVRVTGVGKESIQGDVAFAQVLAAMGARIEIAGTFIEAMGGSLQGMDVDCEAIPDAAMTLAVVALFAHSPTLLRNIGSWRVKETDRIDAMARELRKVGATVETGDDWMRITPGVLTDATIDTYDDHRMAMCFSLLSFGNVAITIRDPQCVRKTFPTYFDALQTIQGG